MSTYQGVFFPKGQHFGSRRKKDGEEKQEEKDKSGKAKEVIIKSICSRVECGADQ